MSTITIVSPMPATYILSEGPDKLLIVRAVRKSGMLWWKSIEDGYAILVRVPHTDYGPWGVDVTWGWKPRYFTESLDDAQEVAKTFMPIRVGMTQ